MTLSNGFVTSAVADCTRLVAKADPRKRFLPLKLFFPPTRITSLCLFFKKMERSSCSLDMEHLSKQTKEQLGSLFLGLNGKWKKVLSCGFSLFLHWFVDGFCAAVFRLLFSTCVPSCSQLKLARRWKPLKEETCKSRPVIDCFVTIFSVALYLFFFLYRFVYFVHVSVLPPSSCTLNNPNKQQPQQAKATTKNVGFLSLFCWAGNSWQQVKGSDEARAVKAKVFQ